MSTPFGTPQVGGPGGFGQPQTATTTGPNGAATDAAAPQVPDTPQDIVDPNDPRLTSEAVDMNTSGDAFAQPAPPPDGKYRAKLKLEGIKLPNGDVVDYVATQTKKSPPLPYFHTGISASIIDPSGKYDGIVLYPAYGGFVGTLQGRDGSSKVSTILGRLKQPSGQPWSAPGVKMTQKNWIDLFVKALKGEPEVVIDTQWQWSCQACGEAAAAARKAGQQASYPKGLEGITHFPQEQDAAKRKDRGHAYSNEVRCPVNVGHGFSRAKAVVVGFSEVK